MTCPLLPQIDRESCSYAISLDHGDTTLLALEEIRGRQPGDAPAHDHDVATIAFRRIIEFNKVIGLGAGLFTQAGEASTRVFDFDLEGNLGRGLRAVASYGYADATYDVFRQGSVDLAGKQQQLAPHHTARIWGTKSFPLNQTMSLMAGLGGRYVGRYFTDSVNTIVLPSRLTFDGVVSLRLKEWDLALNVINLTDNERYFVSNINSGDQFYPGPPFHTTLTLRYQFR